jgi:predicted nucleic acid-binding protein
MKPKVYLETTVISCLTAWRSPQLLMAANQEVTRTWWDEHRHKYDLYISAAVRDEASRGDEDAVRRRLEVVDTVEQLSISSESAEFVAQILSQGLLPRNAAVDALHIAVAALHGMDYLLTWNCRHIANATLRLPINQLIEARGLTAPVICTPLELIGGLDDVE